jgi:hypothetical protein
VEYVHSRADSAAGPQFANITFNKTESLDGLIQYFTSPRSLRLPVEVIKSMIV